jgi:iron complex outermembrane receptor protein
VDVTDPLQLIAGLRYSSEKKTTYAAFNNPNPPLFGKKTFKATTPRVSVKYAFNDYSNVYFTFSKGFKSGGTQGTAFLAPPSAWSTVVYQPEKVTAYEVGLKTAPTRDIRLNVAGYWYDYKDLQVQVQNASGLAQTTNAATARIYGVDADASVSLLHARYQNFKNAVVLRPAPPLPNGQLRGNVNLIVDASGNVLPRAPSYTFTLVTDYNHEMTAGTVNLNLALFFTDKIYFDSDERVHQPAYALANATAAFTPHGTNVRLEAWVKNLANKTYISSTFVQAVSDVVGYGPKRTYGVTATYSF